MGTAAYLAPEQVGGRPVTGAADVYALGLVLIEALSGQLPFDGTQHEMVAARMSHDPYIPAGLPPDWVRLLRAMTRRDPAARPDAATVVLHFEAPSAVDLGGDPADTREMFDLGDDATAALPAPAGDGAPRPSTETGVAERAPVGWLAALVPLVLLTAFFFATSRNDDGPREEATPTTTSTPSSSSGSTVGSSAAATTATTDPSSTSTTPVTRPASSTATCASLNSQRQALDGERRQIDQTYRHDRATREALRDQLDVRRRALDDQRQAFDC